MVVVVVVVVVTTVFDVGSVVELAEVVIVDEGRGRGAMMDRLARPAATNP